MVRRSPNVNYLSVRRDDPSGRIGLCGISDRTFAQSASEEALAFTNAFHFDRCGIDTAFNALQTFCELHRQCSEMSWPFDQVRITFVAAPRAAMVPTNVRSSRNSSVLTVPPMNRSVAKDQQVPMKPSGPRACRTYSRATRLSPHAWCL